jgi:hypothetical protein
MDQTLERGRKHEFRNRYFPVSAELGIRLGVILHRQPANVTDQSAARDNSVRSAKVDDLLIDTATTSAAPFAVLQSLMYNL